MKKKILLLCLPLLVGMVSCNNNQNSSSAGSSSQDITQIPNTEVVDSSTNTSEPIPSTDNSTSEAGTSNPTSDQTTSNTTSEEVSSSSTSENSSSQETITQSNFKVEFNKTSANNAVNASHFILSEGLTATTNACYGTGGNAIRLGSSKNSGKLTLKFKKPVKILEIKVTAKNYNKDKNPQLKVTLGNQDTKSQPITKNSTYTYHFESSALSNSVVFETKKSLRVEISKIEVVCLSSDQGEIPETRTSLEYKSNFALTKGKMPETKETYEGYYRPTKNDNLNLDNYNYFTLDGTLPSIGKQKLLVVPVDFTDYRASSLRLSEEESQKNIYDTFFGNEEDTGWESLRTYYEKTSYGALTLEGSVTPWYHTTYSTQEFFNLEDENASFNYDPTWTLLNEVTEWATNSLNIDISEYDQNKDGLVDGVWMVYSCPAGYYSEPLSERDVFWAYTFGNYDNYDRVLEENDPNLILPFKYCWASYHFMNEGDYGKPDAHTFIHETGHMMGLDDYYSYDQEVIEGVSGGVDMMDLNIGDHGAYSKYLLNWTSPYVIDGTKNQVDIKLKPFESSGEFILLKDGFNDSPYDEYLLIEYYTPTGLNELDSKGYASGFNTYKQPGIKISHVDSRIGLVNLDYDGNITGGSYVDNFDENALTNDNGYMICASNTPAYSTALDLEGDPYRLLHLIEADNDYKFNTSAYQDKYGLDKVLFHQGDTFSMEKYNKFFTRGKALNDTSILPYTITIGSTNSDGTINISITK